ncbi:MAG: hypothetical protein R3B57_05110 [Phycisphaerales bacterium]
MRDLPSQFNLYDLVSAWLPGVTLIALLTPLARAFGVDTTSLGSGSELIDGLLWLVVAYVGGLLLQGLAAVMKGFPIMRRADRSSWGAFATSPEAARVAKLLADRWPDQFATLPEPPSRAKERDRQARQEFKAPWKHALEFTRRLVSERSASDRPERLHSLAMCLRSLTLVFLIAFAAYAGAYLLIVTQRVPDGEDAGGRPVIVLVGMGLACLVLARVTAGRAVAFIEYWAEELAMRVIVLDRLGELDPDSGEEKK